MSFEMDRVRHVGDVVQPQWGTMSKQAFTTKVMPLFGLALLVASGGVVAGMQLLAVAGGLAMPILIGAFVAELALVFTSGWWSQKQGLNKVLFFLYAALSGLTLVPILLYTAGKGGLPIVAQALAVTAATFGGCAVYGLTTKRDFSGMGGFLVIMCLGLLVAGIANFFFQSSMLTLLCSIAGVGIFAAFTVYDMNQIRNTYTDDDAMMAALGLFINFIGMFTSVLRLFGLSVGNDD